LKPERLKRLSMEDFVKLMIAHAWISRT
jgi:hypothetical protein